MNDTTAPTGRTVKVPHLVMALLFLGAVGVWALVASGSVGTDQVAFLAPGVLVAAGVLGLLASVLSARNRGRRTSAASVPPAATDPGLDLHDDPHDDLHDDLEHTAPVTPHRDEESR